MSKFPLLIVEVIDRNVSDHNPLVLDFDVNVVQRSRPFRFLNVLSEYNDFQNLVAAQWKFKQHNLLLLDVWFKLKYLKGPP